MKKENQQEEKEFLNEQNSKRTSESSNIIYENKSKRIPSSDKQKTPKFPFQPWQINLHIIFMIIIVIVCIGIYQSYIYRNLNDIKGNLKRSWLSDMIENTINDFNDYQEQKMEDLVEKQSKQLQLVQIFGLKVNIFRDSHDPQWQAYRSNMWVLIFTALSWRFITYLAYLFDKFICIRKTYIQTTNHFSYINRYIFIFSFMILLFSFRADIVFYLSIIFAWYVYVEILLVIRFQKIGIKNQRKIKLYNSRAIMSMWAIMLVTLYLNQRYQHFRFLSEWFQTLIPQYLEIFKNSYRAIHCSQLLNMTFLRLLSYGIDRIHQGDKHWVENQQRLKQKKMIPCEQCQQVKTSKNQIKEGEKQEIEILYCYKGRDHIPKLNHSFRQYLNYTLFTPLMLTGPPISYNNYCSFQNLPAPQVTIKQCLYHIFLLLAFQVHQHLFPVINPRQNMTLVELQLFSLMHLFFIWFKFLIIWRTAKIWAHLYGVHVIDNMSRCILNNYGFQGFWRMWHRGFNQWLIRYLYIPLGGNKNTLFSVICTIAFVAFWHDHTINIIFWALIIALLMVPEILIKRYFRTNHKNLYTKHWFKYLSGFISAIYIYFLIICNLIGFGYGIQKMGLVWQKITSNIPQLIWSILVITSACMTMFYKRNTQNNTKNY